MGYPRDPRSYGEQTAQMKKGVETLRIDTLEAEIIDLRQTLAGNSTAKRWRLLQLELTNKEASLRSLLEIHNHNCLPDNRRFSSLVELRPERI